MKVMSEWPPLPPLRSRVRVFRSVRMGTTSREATLTCVSPTGNICCRQTVSGQVEDGVAGDGDGEAPEDGDEGIHCLH